MSKLFLNNLFLEIIRLLLLLFSSIAKRIDQGLNNCNFGSRFSSSSTLSGNTMVCTVIMQMSNMRGQFHDCAGGGLANIWMRASIRRKEQYSTFEGSIRIGWKGREEGDSFEGRKKLKEERGSYLKEGEPRFKEGCKYKGKGKQRKVMPRLQLFSRVEEAQRDGRKIWGNAVLKPSYDRSFLRHLK